MIAGSGWPLASVRLAYLPEAMSDSMMPRRKLDKTGAVGPPLVSLLMDLFLEIATLD
jgi:hypothetical protein